MKYIDFASKISFYEFVQNEFKDPHFKIEKYREELELLSGNLTIDKLIKILESTPTIIDIFEEFFQLSRFTNTQLIYFCFDVNILNNSANRNILDYAEKSIFVFENGYENKYFNEIFNKNNIIDENEKIFYIKKTIIKYIDKLLKTREILYKHIKNSISSRLRISRYLIENLKADKYVKKINIKNYLELKRKPVDTKGMHGKFGTIKIKNILKQNNFEEINNLVSEKIISLDNPILLNKFSFATEKCIKGILKRKDNRLKVFDFIIFYNGKAIILIETNFYSTSGTKIGINQGEYIDLLEDINNFNQNNNTNLKFIWITDGNYWLLKEGENRFENLKQNYFKKDFELLNYNLFKSNLNKIIKEISE